MEKMKNKTKAETHRAVSLLFSFSLIFSLFSISFISAFNFELEGEKNLGTFKQGDCVSLVEMCDNCSYVNITLIQYPDSSISNVNYLMTKNGFDYNYSFCDTSNLGKYFYNVKGDKDSTDSLERLEFKITSSGNYGASNIVFIVILFFGLYGLNLLGFFNRNATITALGGIALMFLGLYTVQNGIIIYRDNLTLALSYITLFWGIGSALWAIVEELELF